MSDGAMPLSSDAAVKPALDYTSKNGHTFQDVAFDQLVLVRSLDELLLELVDVERGRPSSLQDVAFH